MEVSYLKDLWSKLGSFYSTLVYRGRLTSQSHLSVRNHLRVSEITKEAGVMKKMHSPSLFPNEIVFVCRHKPRFGF